MLRILPAALIAVVLSSCHFFSEKKIKGDGNIVKQDRNIKDFTGIRVEGAFEVVFEIDSVFSVKVETDNNLQEHVETSKEGGMLVIRPPRNTSISSSEVTKIYVSAPTYHTLSAAGACGFYSNGTITSNDGLDLKLDGACNAEITIETSTLSVDLDGACGAVVKGKTGSLIVTSSGSNDMDGEALSASDASIDMSGAGTTVVNVSGKLTAKAEGATNIRYKGNASVDAKVSGAGSVKAL